MQNERKARRLGDSQGPLVFWSLAYRSIKYSVLILTHKYTHTHTSHAGLAKVSSLLHPLVFGVFGSPLLSYAACKCAHEV